jgi:hypothetical protein
MGWPEAILNSVQTLAGMAIVLAVIEHFKRR